MKKCLNCKSDVRDTDIYCRNCGCLLQSNKHYVLQNVLTAVALLGYVALIALIVASYFMDK